MLELVAPISGWATPLEEVPDAAFSQKMVGDGIAIDPTSSELRAPCDGVVVSMHDAHHACIVRCDEGVEVLLHIGIDTVGLRGEGFSPLIRAGNAVKKGDPLIAFDIELLASKARGLFTLMIVVNGDEYAIANRVHSREVAVGDPLLALTSVGSPSQWKVAGETAERTAILRVAHGLHARPAARLADHAKQHPVAVRIGSRGRSANGKSVAALMALGARSGDTLAISVQGRHAARVAEDLASFVAALADQSESLSQTHAVVSEVAKVADALPPLPPNQEVLLRGAAAVAGLAQGCAVRTVRQAVEIAKDGIGVGAERRALNDAIAGVRRDLEAAIDAALPNGLEAGILSVHLSLLDDPEIADAASQAIGCGRSAAWAWAAAVERYAAVLGALDDPSLAERAADFRDIENRVIRFLSAGGGAGPRARLPANAILVADELRPSDLIESASARPIAVCTARGGPTSHGAILAASMGIPTVVALGETALRVPEGAPLIVDGDRGQVIVFPAEATRRAAVDERFRRVARREAHRAARHREGRTRDGVRVEVLANLGRPGDAAEAVANGAEGCGLLRTEFLFLHRTEAPSADEQAAQYQEIATTLEGRPFVARTLDVGGDKPLAYLRMPAEENPALGLRGIRFALRHPELLRAQLGALLRVETKTPIRILLPMVTSVTEVRAVRVLIEAERRALGEERPALVGAMIELPIAAVSTDILASEVDFFSLGTNDLTQYASAADRANPEVAPFLDGLHPGVLRLIAQAIGGARAWHRPLAVCGGMASDPRTSALLIGLGVTELSAAPVVIPDLKGFIATLTVADCVEVAQQSLALESAEEVRALLHRTWPVI